MWHVLGSGMVSTVFLWGTLRERDYLEDIEIDGHVILKWIFKKWNLGGMHQIFLAPDSDRWQAVVNVVMNL